MDMVEASPALSAGALEEQPRAGRLACALHACALGRHVLHRGGAPARAQRREGAAVRTPGVAGAVALAGSDSDNAG